MDLQLLDKHIDQLIKLYAKDSSPAGPTVGDMGTTDPSPMGDPEAESVSDREYTTPSGGKGFYPRKGVGWDSAGYYNSDKFCDPKETESECKDRILDDVETRLEETR